MIVCPPVASQAVAMPSLHSGDGGDLELAIADLEARVSTTDSEAREAAQSCEKSVQLHVEALSAVGPASTRLAEAKAVFERIRPEIERARECVQHITRKELDDARFLRNPPRTVQRTRSRCSAQQR